MKISFLQAFLLLVPSLFFGQIPNGGFESWTNNGNYDVPDQWETLNSFTSSLGVFTATKGTPGSPGSSYLKLTSKTVGPSVVNGIAATGTIDFQTLTASGGFPYSDQPVSFTGKYQHMIFGSSQGELTATLTRWDAQSGQRIVVAVADEKLAGMAMSWTNFTIPFIYSDAMAPDTCSIILKASGNNPTNNDYLWVDNMSFSGSVAGVKDNFNSFVVFNNPTSDFAIVQSNGEIDIADFVLLDSNGKDFSSKISASELGIIVDLQALSNGVYFLNSKNKSFESIRLLKSSE